jgi:hypothetical protein
MAWNTRQLADWGDFVSMVDTLGIGKENGPSWFFRGQADASWGLTPSLLRHFRGRSLSYKKAHGIERQASDFFFSRMHLLAERTPNLQVTDRNVVLWAMMQHHSCPTRLLDWTESPFVALYFAVEKLMELDGALWLFEASTLDTLMTKAFGNLAYNNSIYFQDPPSPAVYPVVPVQHTQRSAAQQGVFTIGTDLLSDHEAPMEAQFERAGKSKYLQKLVVPAALKYELLSRLRVMNISAISLFPGIDGLGRAALEGIRLRVKAFPPIGG